MCTLRAAVLVGRGMRCYVYTSRGGLSRTRNALLFLHFSCFLDSLRAVAVNTCAEKLCFVSAPCTRCVPDLKGFLDMPVVCFISASLNICLR